MSKPKSELPDVSLRVSQVVASINELVGGPARSVTQLSSHLAYHQVHTTLFTLDYPHLGCQLSAGDAVIRSFPAHLVARRMRGWHRGLANALVRDSNHQIIHNHGLWMMPNRYARMASVKRGVPLVVSPRGMLDPWSLGYSKWSKRLAWSAYEARNLSATTLFHATSNMEHDAIRRLGFQQPIAVIPNGVELEPLQAPVERSVIETRFPPLKDQRWLVFMSRLHPKKGIENLLEVWRRVSLRFKDTILVIAGSEIDSYESKLREMVDDLQLHDRVCFTGNLSGADKSCVLQHACVLALPTYAENFGIVIAEALVCGTPVVTTHHAPWEELVTHRCGWWIENTVTQLESSLIDALSSRETELAAMGRRGTELVQSKYTWGPIADQLQSVYRWLVSTGPQPSCVRTVA